MRGRKPIACLLLLVLCLLPVLTACQTGADPSGTETTGETPTDGAVTSAETPTDPATQPEDPVQPVPEPVQVVTGETSRYQLIYDPDDKAAQIVASALLKLVSGETGCLLDFYEDSGKPASADAYEILIGATDRQESIAAVGALAEGEYSIAVTERKIVLAGADGYALSVAVAEFYETAHSGKNLTVPAGFEKRGKVTFAADASYPIAVTEGKQNEVLMYDLAKGGLTDDNVIKRFSVGGSGAADVRLREWHGRQVVLSAGGYHAKLLDWETGDVLWSYEGTLIWNAHAMELLPDGILAVAGSTGNNLTFFSLTDRTATPLRLEFADAHGAMWDPSHTCLWVCGGNQMKAYRVTQSGGRIAAEEIRSLTIPANGAHDLQPVYGTPGTYWLTTSGTVFRFDSNTETFRAVPTSSQLGMKGVKGMGNFTDGCIVQTIADGSDNSWNTATVWLYRYNATLNLYVPTAFVSPTGAALYKVRVWSAAYQ